MKFAEARMEQGFAKIGILGFAGSGKTYTGHNVARGLHKLIKSKKPVVCIETESGSDFMVRLYRSEGIPFEVAKTRAFADLVSTPNSEGLLQGACDTSDILVIDSITHFWEDIVQSYQRKNNLKFIAFQDWNILKPMWRREFTDWFLSSRLHIIICGRAGFEYDYFEDKDGEMHLYKTGTKMKVENEMGYEPSLLIEMERAKVLQVRKSKKGKGQAQPNIPIGSGWTHRAHVVKDRAQLLDGQEFDNPDFNFFLPHITSLNIGGEHVGVKEGDSTELFEHEGKPQWKWEKEQKDVLIAEFFAGLDKNYPSPTTPAQKRARILMGEECFGVKSREAIDALDYNKVRLGADKAKWYLSQEWLVAALLDEKEASSSLSQAKDAYREMLSRHEVEEDTP